MAWIRGLRMRTHAARATEVVTGGIRSHRDGEVKSDVSGGDSGDS